MINYKLYKAGKALVTGMIFTGIIMASSVTAVNADTISNTNKQFSSDTDKNIAKRTIPDAKPSATPVSDDQVTTNTTQDTTKPVTHIADNHSTTNIAANTKPSTTSVSNDKPANSMTSDTEPIKNGWVVKNGVNSYYENDKLVTGEKKIADYWYNFNHLGQYSTGLTRLDSKTAFYDKKGHMYYGYLKTDNTYMYFDTSDGHAVTGERYYGNHQMEYYGQDFKQVRNNYVRTGNTFYFIGQYGDAVTGLRYYGKQPNQVEYYGTNFKQLRNMSITLNGRNYRFGSNGDLIIANKPVYFSQLDSRWSSHRFNDYTMGEAGCVPTSIAMVLNGSYGVRVSPDDVRNVMNTISVSSFGATGIDLINTVRHYGQQVEQLNTVAQTVQLLKQGVPVIFYVNVSGNIGHAIATYGYTNGATQVYDPYNRYYYNGWYDVNYLSRNLSRDRNDWNAGRPVFAIM